MKRLLQKVGRFFWSLAFLKFCLWTITFIILFYAEEDWRGARTWAATKAKWEARGETFDYRRLVPPPVPDDQNLALPLFRMQPDPADPGQFQALALQRALRENFSDMELPSIGDWRRERLPDPDLMRKGIAAIFQREFKKAPTLSDATAQLEELYPAIFNLRRVTDSRPYCRFPEDYSSEPAYGRTMSVMWLIKISRILCLHAVIALHENHPELALPDLQLLLKLAHGAAAEPVLVSGLVTLAMNNMCCNVIDNGLALHAWNDAQLQQLQQSLATFDPLTEYQLIMRGEIVGFVVPNLDYLRVKRPSIVNFFGLSETEKPFFYATDPAFHFWPGGWLDLNMARSVDDILGSIHLVDPATHRVYADQVERMEARLQRFSHTWRGMAPWNLFSSITSYSDTNSVVEFACSQAWLDQARLASALERYRLVRRQYPAALTELVPDFIPAQPHDVTTGQPYHYRLQPDGSFLLYSVGWDAKDSGGKNVLPKDLSFEASDLAIKQGDWAWPILK